MEDTPQRAARPRAKSIPLVDMSSEMPHGLGIDITSANRTSQESTASTRTQLRNVSSIDDGDQRTPSSAHPLTSPPSTGGLSGSTQYGYSPISTFSPYRAHAKHSHSFSSPSVPPPLPADSEASLLSKRHTASMHSAYGDFAARHKCENVRGVKGSRTSWFSVTTIVLSVYSTIFSGIFFFIAVIGPSYSWVRTDGKLTASSAAFLTSVLAKTIELSFVTVIIALLGQELSRKASSSHRRSGVTLAELNMRSWIVQPGTMISRWESVRYAGITTLGFISLIAALFAMLYTSAATALVQPRLSFDRWTHIEMKGLVKASFANKIHIAEDCHHPLPSGLDPKHRAETCLSIEHAAMAYHNYYDYLKAWSERTQSSPSNGRLIPSARPYGTALLGNDTSVIAPWVENRLNNTSARIWNSTDEDVIRINNVSLAFPHTGVASASKDAVNNIMQPEDLDGLGIYRLNASVPSPVVHVLCATLSEERIAPLIFEKWNATDDPINGTAWPAQLEFTDEHPSPYLGGTDLDDIFEWGERYGDGAWPPVFPMLPKNYNTMVNSTWLYNRTSIYILGRSPGIDPENAPDDSHYFLCQLRVTQTPYCYTTYQASAQGATLEAVCPDDHTHHPMQYIASVPDAQSVTPSREWPNVASQWALALALNDGAFGGDSSNARLLTQLLLQGDNLEPETPSLAEALAVLAGCTLLQSTLDAPFTTYWPYPETEPIDGILDDPKGVYESFNATIRAQKYSSGGSERYQKAFHIVLLGVFGLNILALAYFAMHKTWYTDFSETPTLFSLAVNSPPSEAFSGCCGTGPQGKDYGVAWTLEQDDGHVFVHSGGRREGDGGEESGRGVGLKRRKAWRSLAGSPVVKNWGKFRRWSREV